MSVPFSILCSDVKELEKKLDELGSRTELESLEEGNKENVQAIHSELYCIGLELPSFLCIEDTNEAYLLSE